MLFVIFVGICVAVKCITNSLYIESLTSYVIACNLLCRLVVVHILYLLRFSWSLASYLSDHMKLSSGSTAIVGGGTVPQYGTFALRLTHHSCCSEHKNNSLSPEKQKLETPPGTSITPNKTPPEFHTSTPSPQPAYTLPAASH